MGCGLGRLKHIKNHEFLIFRLDKAHTIYTSGALELGQSGGLGRGEKQYSSHLQSRNVPCIKSCCHSRSCHTLKKKLFVVTSGSGSSANNKELVVVRGFVVHDGHYTCSAAS